MEQANRTRAHLERILLVCGLQNAGKSRLLRHMLGDYRLNRQVPPQARFGFCALSRERCLAVRFTSPHERNETPTDFHKKIDRTTERAWNNGFWRINFASAVQPRALNNMPDIVEVCEGLQKAFAPERIRVVQLAPDQWGNFSSQLTNAEIDGLRKLEDVEVVAIDARRSNYPVEPGNVRILADFFDFS